jgi:hypothetical protein
VLSLVVLNPLLLTILKGHPTHEHPLPHAGVARVPYGTRYLPHAGVARVPRWALLAHSLARLVGAQLSARECGTCDATWETSGGLGLRCNA